MEQEKSLIDTSVHFYDREALSYPHLKRLHLSFASHYGDYSSLPSHFHRTDYPGSRKAIGVEFGSKDRIREANWLSKQADGVVAGIEILSEDFFLCLSAHTQLPNLCAVREGLRSVTSFHLLDFKWRSHFKAVVAIGIPFEVEIYANQIPDLIELVHLFPSHRFILSAMGWPREDHEIWINAMRILSKCENVAVKVCSLDGVFGSNWTVEMVRPWIEDLMELFGFHRVMFGSSFPWPLLSHKMRDPFTCYQKVLRGCSKEEREWAFKKAAEQWYHIEV